MSRIDNIKGKGVKFSKEYQPTPKAKSNGTTRIKKIREAIEYFSSQVKSKIKDNDGNNIELTYESNIFYMLIKKANKGDLKAIELIMKVIPGFLATTKNAIVDENGKVKDNTLKIVWEKK